ncbi:LysR family transcriptional regulator [Marinobacterium jannaschii]|uniref:LysR family transcriptional regulator n=1 Tax=Marinobacterium jannaschii TaxID=64970 RepID=UPI0004864456|nr:LysR family transcriptional regulator [Marinobacterium jannaschii]
MSLKALRALQAIDRHGSFAAAGEQLGLTQAAISQQVHQLEDQLGLRLFDKVGRSQVLNHDGRIVLERSEAILSAYSRLGEGLGDPTQFRGELMIGAVFSVQTGPLGPVLARLRDLYPQLKIKVFRGMSDELMRRVENSELDAVLITEPRQPFSDTFSWHTLDSEPFYVVAHRSLRAESDEQLLREQPFMRLDPKAFAGTMIDNELRRRGIIPNEIMELDSLQAATMMVEQQLGITVMPFGSTMYPYYSERFRVIPFGSPVIHRNLGVYQRREHSRRTLVRVLIEEYERYLAEPEQNPES